MSKETPKQVDDNLVVTLNYTMRIEDEVMESTNDNKPIEFIQGENQILPALEEAVYGMTVGEMKTVILTPAEAYGEIDPEAIHKANQDEFAIDVPLKVGTFLDFRDEDENILSAQIIAKDEDTVTLDFNHPLAGQDLTFEMTVVGLRQATEEELAHGHVH